MFALKASLLNQDGFCTYHTLTSSCKVHFVRYGYEFLKGIGGG